MKILSQSEVQMKLSKLVEKVSKKDEAILITRNSGPAAILLSPDEYCSWQETLSIRSDEEFMAEIRKGLEELKRTRKLHSLEQLLGD